MRLKDAQGNRVAAYREFEGCETVSASTDCALTSISDIRGFQSMLELDSFEDYPEHCRSITTAFAGISNRIRAIEVICMACPCLIRMLTELCQNRMLSAEEGSVMYRMAPYVRQLQTHEQQKLQLVLCTCLYQCD